MSTARDSRYVREVGEKLRNWGKWGDDDENGTLNYITPDCVIEATKLAKRGKIIRLGLNYDKDGPILATGHIVERFNPIHLMTIDGGDAAIGAMTWPGGWQAADDMIIMPLQCATHWDSLAHVFYDDKLYNGYSMAEVSSAGAKKNSIDKICQGIVARGVHLDIARFKNKDLLEGGYGITPEELDACAESQGIAVRRGDVVCIRTGFIQKFIRDGDRATYMGDRPGLSFECVHWLHQHQVAAVAADTTGLEVYPNGFVDGCRLPLHMVALRDMGMTIGEMFNLEALSTDCAENGVYEFLFVGVPLPITGAVGSPVNPLAVK